MSLAVAALSFQTGCGTIYSDVYAPKRNYFKAPVEKTAATELPPETATTPQSAILPGGSPELPPAVAPEPAMPATPPEIPGMDPAAPAPVPGMEAAPAPAPAPAPEAAPAMEATPPAQ